MGPYKCPECGVWWVGFEHRCRPPLTAADTDGWVVRPYNLPDVGTGITTPMSYCPRCAGLHTQGSCPNSTTTVVPS